MGNNNVKEMYQQYIDAFCEREISWKQHNFWTFLFTSWKDEEIYNLLSIEDIRKLRKDQPANLGMLIFKCLEQVILFSKEEEENTEQLCIRNSINYLTRILPIIFEHNDDNFLNTFFSYNIIPSFRAIKKALPEGEESGEEDEESEEGTISGDENEGVEKEKKKNTSGFVPFNPNEEDDAKEVIEIKEVKKEKEYVEDVREFKKISIDEEIKKEVNSIVSKVVERVVALEKEKKEKISKKKKLVPPERDSSMKNKKKKNSEISHNKIREISLEPMSGGNKIKNIGNEMLNVPIYKKIIFMLMQSMFLSEFSIPKSQIKPTFKKVEGLPESLDVNLLWEGGLVVPKGKFYPSSKQVDNRRLLLRNIIACCSSSLFVNQIDLNLKGNLFLQSLVSSSTPFSANLFYSCLNIIGNYNPTGSLPYTSVLFNDHLEEITLLSIQFLCLVLCSDLEDNIYIEYVKKINKKKDFKFLYNIFLKLFKNSINSDNTYLPKSQKSIIFQEELFVLFWKLLQHNHDFRMYICRSEDITKILSSILYTFYKHSKDIQMFPFLQVIGFVLLLLSEERLFAVSLNKRFSEKIPIKLPLFSGNYFDFIIILFHKLIVEDTKLIIKPLLNCMLTVFHNISPYAKKLSITTSVKLLNLFELFTNVRFLYANDTNYDLVFLMLHSFNNIIQYQYNGNVNLVYSIMRRQKVFKNLAKDVNVKKIIDTLEAKKISFKPTERWIKSWKSKLPLDVIASVIETLVPDVEKYCKTHTATEEDVLTFLRNTTLVGVLPVPHSIIVRTLFVSERIQTFLVVYVWSLIYIKELGYLMPNATHYDSQRIKLFTVRNK